MRFSLNGILNIFLQNYSPFWIVSLFLHPWEKTRCRQRTSSEVTKSKFEERGWENFGKCLGYLKNGMTFMKFKRNVGNFGRNGKIFMKIWTNFQQILGKYRVLLSNFIEIFHKILGKFYKYYEEDLENFEIIENFYKFWNRWRNF